MYTQSDISTVELSRTQLKLRSDIRFVPQQYGDETWYHLEVRGAREYYRIGYAEYCFISLIDGNTSFAQALAVSAQVLGSSALSQQQAMTVYSWLLERGLATFADDESASSGRAETAANRNQHNLLSRLNPLWMRIPLGRPEPILNFLQPWLGWIFSPTATVVGVLLMVISSGVLVSQWTRFAAASDSVFAPDNWLWLLIAWIGLKIVHELAHGLVCLRYGGDIRSMGIVLAFLAPLAYVDASSCWSFALRRHRIHTAIAGIYIELLIASAAIIWWSQTESAVLAHVLYSVIVMASLSTVLFNLNPLMRFDGYFILSDLLHIPNLYSESSTVLSEVLRTLIFGDLQTAPAVRGQRRYFMLLYGAAAVAWRLTVCVSLLIAASVLFHGAGIALAIGGFLAWFAKPIWNWIKSVRQMLDRSPPRLLRGTVVLGSLAAVVCVLLFILPAPLVSTAPGIVEYTDGQVVRAITPGFVSRIHVIDGQMVKAGDVLIELSNEEFEAENEDLNLQIAQEEIRLQTATREHNAGAISIARSNLDSLLLRQQQNRKRVAGLQLVAETDGQVVGRQLLNLQDTFVKAGQELLTIGREDQKELRFSVAELDLTSALQRVDQSVAVRIGTRGRVSGTLQRVNPRASRDLPHPALAATSGGQLPVLEDKSKDQDASNTSRLKLTEHRFDAVVKLEPQDAIELRCGERGIAALGRPGGALGVHIFRSGQRWLQAKLDDASRTQ